MLQEQQSHLQQQQQGLLQQLIKTQEKQSEEFEQFKIKLSTIESATEQSFHDTPPPNKGA